MNDQDFMRLAIELSHTSVKAGGGPFGAVIVRDGKVIGKGTNEVVPAADPTAHAEIVAIRDACQKVGSHSLEKATIYTSCEPCPMCLAAIWWARIRAICYGNDRFAAAAIGFDDKAIYDEVSAPLTRRTIPMKRLLPKEAEGAFTAWRSKPDKIPY